jgi:hypothetical protein
MAFQYDNSNKHMKKLIKPLLLSCIASTCMMISCTKENSPGNNNDQDTQSASDLSFAESTSSDIMNISAQSEDNGVTGSYGDSTFSFMLSPCANISIANIASPFQLVVDFGDENCLCYDGKYRRGKILISYTGLYRDSGSFHTITFDNFYVNDYKVDGTTTVVNKGHNTSGNLEFSVNINSIITDTAGHTLSYTSNRTREWVQGENTDGLFQWKDDVYSITGTANGTCFDGTQFSATIANPLIVALNCRWIESGTIEFTPSGQLKRTIDFGNGDCDNKITISIAGLTFNVLLP